MAAKPKRAPKRKTQPAPEPPDVDPQEVLDELLSALKSTGDAPAPASKRNGRTTHRDGENRALLNFDLLCLRAGIQNGDITEAVTRAILATIRAMQLDSRALHVSHNDSRQIAGDERAKDKTAETRKRVLKDLAALVESNPEAESYEGRWYKGRVIKSLIASTGLRERTISGIIPRKRKPVTAKA